MFVDLFVDFFFCNGASVFVYVKAYSLMDVTFKSDIFVRNIFQSPPAVNKENMTNLFINVTFLPRHYDSNVVNDRRYFYYTIYNKYVMMRP